LHEESRVIPCSLYMVIAHFSHIYRFITKFVQFSFQQIAYTFPLLSTRDQSLF